MTAQPQKLCYTWICCNASFLAPAPLNPFGKDRRPHASIATVNAVGCVILTLPDLELTTVHFSCCIHSAQQGR